MEWEWELLWIMGQDWDGWMGWVACADGFNRMYIVSHTLMKTPLIITFLLQINKNNKNNIINFLCEVQFSIIFWFSFYQ